MASQLTSVTQCNTGGSYYSQHPNRDTFLRQNSNECRFYNSLDSHGQGAFEDLVVVNTNGGGEDFQSLRDARKPLFLPIEGCRSQSARDGRAATRVPPDRSRAAALGPVASLLTANQNTDQTPGLPQGPSPPRQAACSIASMLTQQALQQTLNEKMQNPLGAPGGSAGKGLGAPDTMGDRDSLNRHTISRQFHASMAMRGGGSTVRQLHQLYQNQLHDFNPATRIQHNVSPKTSATKIRSRRVNDPAHEAMETRDGTFITMDGHPVRTRNARYVNSFTLMDGTAWVYPKATVAREGGSPGVQDVLMTGDGSQDVLLPEGLTDHYRPAQTTTEVVREDGSVLMADDAMIDFLERVLSGSEKSLIARMADGKTVGETKPIPEKPGSLFINGKFVQDPDSSANDIFSTEEENDSSMLDSGSYPACPTAAASASRVASEDLYQGSDFSAVPPFGTISGADSGTISCGSVTSPPAFMGLDGASGVNEGSNSLCGSITTDTVLSFPGRVPPSSTSTAPPSPVSTAPPFPMAASLKPFPDASARLPRNILLPAGYNGDGAITITHGTFDTVTDGHNIGSLSAGSGISVASVARSNGLALATVVPANGYDPAATATNRGIGNTPSYTTTNRFHGANGTFGGTTTTCHVPASQSVTTTTEREIMRSQEIGDRSPTTYVPASTPKNGGGGITIQWMSPRPVSPGPVSPSRGRTHQPVAEVAPDEHVTDRLGDDEVIDRLGKDEVMRAMGEPQGAEVVQSVGDVQMTKGLQVDKTNDSTASDGEIMYLDDTPGTKRPIDPSTHQFKHTSRNVNLPDTSQPSIIFESLGATRESNFQLPTSFVESGAHYGTPGIEGSGADRPPPTANVTADRRAATANIREPRTPAYTASITCAALEQGVRHIFQPESATPSSGRESTDTGW